VTHIFLTHTQIKLAIFLAVVFVLWGWPYLKSLFIKGRHGVILQKGVVDCALACAQMVGSNYDKTFEYSYISQRIKLTRRGASFLDLQGFFEAEGFVAEGFRDGIECLNDAAGNVIAAVYPRHFLVVEARLPDGAFLVKDPSSGLMRVPGWVFRLWYRGVYLKIMLPSNPLLSPTPNEIVS
jgi:ABC-type bacteriocin/lantibiotic exporter with double-glycine peptidase domain